MAREKIIRNIGVPEAGGRRLFFQKVRETRADFPQKSMTFGRQTIGARARVGTSFSFLFVAIEILLRVYRVFRDECCRNGLPSENKNARRSIRCSGVPYCRGFVHEFILVLYSVRSVLGVRTPEIKSASFSVDTHGCYRRVRFPRKFLPDAYKRRIFILPITLANKSFVELFKYTRAFE